MAHGTEALGHPSGTAMVVANPDYVTVEARALRVMPGKNVWFSLLTILGTTCIKW